MVANINPETGIRYGIIAANSLDPELVSELQMNGKDLHWEEALADLRKQIEHEVNQGVLALEDADDEYAIREELLADDFYDDEPAHSFDVDGVKGQTTWLGGGLMVWCFESPHTGTFQLCSPCVPGACDLDSPVNPLRETIGHIGYDVPPTWRMK